MTTWTREMAVELAREEHERGLAEGRAEAAVEIERLRAEMRKLRGHLERIKRAVKDEPDEDGGPW